MSSQASPASATSRSPNEIPRSNRSSSPSGSRQYSRSRSRSPTPENNSGRSRSGSPRSQGSRTPSSHSEAGNEPVQERKGKKNYLPEVFGGHCCNNRFSIVEYIYIILRYRRFEFGRRKKRRCQIEEEKF